MLERVFRSISMIETRGNAQKKDKLKDIKGPMHGKIVTTKLLPDNISSSILDLQMECEKQTISKETVFQLIAQYTKAIEFYEEAGNEKYKLYQKRMQNFLAKPMIESILKGQSGQMVIKRERNEEKVRHAENKAEKQVKKLIEKHQEKEIKHEQIIQNELSKQQQELEQRIRNKRINSNKSVKSSKVHYCEDFNNEESGKKSGHEETMNMQLILKTIGQRSSNKKVFL